MEKGPQIIKGGRYIDQRGTISFVNDFDMSQIKRFYIIEHPSTQISRGWRAHKIEQRWFHVVNGGFVVRLVQISNWDSPSKNTPINEFVLSSQNKEVLHIPVGFASLIQATEDNSTMIVFSDYGIENAESDDFQFSPDYFKGTKK